MIEGIYLLAPLSAYFVAHLIKFTVRAWRGDVNFRYFYLSGGMPSAHAATVTALLVTVAALDGIDSAIFGIAAVFAAIVIYDSFGVRRAAGNQGLVLNKLTETLARDSEDEELLKMQLQPVLGHSPGEVIAGIATGATLGATLTYQAWVGQLAFLAVIPPQLELYILLGVYGALALGAIVLRLAMGRGPKRNLTSYHHWRSLLWLGPFTAALVGLLFLLAAYENIAFWGWRLWLYLILVLLLLYQLPLWLRWRGLLAPRIASELAARERRREQRKQRRKKQPRKRRK